MPQLKEFIDSLRNSVEKGLSTLEEVQNDLVHVKMEKLKENENISQIVSKVQHLNEQYSGQVYDGLKVLNAVVAQKSKELVDQINSKK